MVATIWLEILTATLLKRTHKNARFTSSWKVGNITDMQAINFTALLTQSKQICLKYSPLPLK